MTLPCQHTPSSALFIQLGEVESARTPLGQSGMQVDDDMVPAVVLDGLLDDVLLSIEEVMLLVSEETAVDDPTELVIELEVESELVLEATDDSVLLMSDDVAIELKLLETEEDSML